MRLPSRNAASAVALCARALTMRSANGLSRASWMSSFTYTEFW